MKKILRWIQHYIFFFLIIAFLVTCCTMLFVTVLSRSLNVTLTESDIALAAKLTFGNVVLLSLVFCIVDTVRRKLTVERPVKRITEAAKKITQGDFSVRVEPMRSFGADETFGQIIDCFNKMAGELSGVETLRTDFVTNVSHEMKTPLAVIQNYAMLLQTPGLSEEKRMEYARGVAEGTRRMADMMTNILKLNRLENQEIYPHSSEFDLGEQICGCLLQFESVWEREGIEIETDLAENVTVKADAELLAHVWNNLFSNAFKFTPRGGKVTVTLSEDARHAVVQVKDTGCGMTAEVGEHIFEKFYKGERSHSTGGNGLGLALVKRVIDIMRAEIAVESTPNVGSTFTVRIPKG